MTRRQTLDSSKLKEFTDDNFKFDENGRKLSKGVENTVGKGEIARDEHLLETLWKKGEIASNQQFLLFLPCLLPICRTFYHFHQT